MKTSQTVVAGLAAATALAVSVAGCGGGQTASPPKSGSPTSKASAPTTDYAKLLIQATDIAAPVAFTASPPSPEKPAWVVPATKVSTPAVFTLNTEFKLLK